VQIGSDRAEEGRAIMIELYPEGFEEVERRSGVELVAYTDAAGEERMWHVFGMGDASDVEEGWEDRWRTFHRPVRVGGLWVGPPWETPPGDALAVVVDPGRAFGTGAHPTTQLCLELLQELEPGSFLDVGCGSGVLSIAAALLGHSPVLAVDIEAPSIVATLENAERNGVELDARVVKGDEPLPAAHSAVANISIWAVHELPARLEAETEVLLTSGYFLSEHLDLAGYTHVTRRTYDGWAADLHHRTI
jgi:ribosomal protein L11 methyltransferase